MTHSRTRLSIVVLIVLTILLAISTTLSQVQGASNLVFQATSIAEEIRSTEQSTTDNYKLLLAQTTEAKFDVDVKAAITAALPTQEAKLLKELAVKQQIAVTTIQAQAKATQIVIEATQLVERQQSQATQVSLAVQQTITALPSPTILPSATPGPPQMNVLMEGCTTGLDALLRRIGEVTTAYVTIQNVGGSDARNVVVALRASDESSQNPDQQKLIQYLPVGHQVTLDLAIGSQFFQNTAVQIIAVTDKGVIESTSRSDCKEIDPDTFDNLFRILRLVTPISKLRLVR